MLKTAKRGTLSALSGMGVLPRVRDSAWRRQQLLILCYHGISTADEHEWDSQFSMHPDVFEDRLRMLWEGDYNVLPLGTALQHLYTRTLPERSVAITFDDGTHDFLQRAYPLLRKYDFPATVYLTTYYCEHDGPVFPVFCSYLLWKARDAVVDVSPLIRGVAQWDLRTRAGRAAALDAIRDFAQRERLDAPAKTAFAKRLAGHIGVDYEAIAASRILHLLTPSDVTALAAEGIDFQLHTHRHRTPNDRSLFIREIEDNRERIQALTGRPATHFCYPSGVHSLDWLPWLADAGVESATTCVPGLASSHANEMLLPRLVDTAHLSPVEFRSWLSGFGALLPRRRSSYGRIAAAAP